MPSPAENQQAPCGPDCAYAAPLPRDPSGEWLKCAHPARGSVVHAGDDCRRFEARTEGRRAPTVEPAR